MTDANPVSVKTTPRPPLQTTAGPHIVHPGLSTRSMMRDVLIGLAAPLVAALYFFRASALQQLVICLLCAWGT